MALVGDTGNGATFTLSGQTAVSTYKIESIDIGELTYDMLDVSHLGTTGHEEKIISDLQKGGDITINYIHSVTATAVTTSTTVETATVTFPVASAQTTTTGATYVGTGNVTGHKLPMLANGQVQKGQIKFSVDGDTGPTYTRGS